MSSFLTDARMCNDDSSKLTLLSLIHHILPKAVCVYIFFFFFFLKKHFICGLITPIESISTKHFQTTSCGACTSICLFSIAGIHVYKCATHPVSFVGSELRVNVCVCVGACVCVFACLSGNWRCGPIWGVSKQAGESHAGCSLSSVLMEFWISPRPVVVSAQSLWTC